MYTVISGNSGMRYKEYMTAAEIRTHLHYTGWASRKVLDAAMALSPEQQAKPMSVSHESILGTLGHIHFADRIWFKRTVQPDLDMPPTAQLSTAESLRTDWQELQRRWEAWADSLTDADVNRLVQFKSTAGAAGEATVTHIVLHLVNHGTLHRGQVVGMLRQLGVKPPTTDIMAYLREMNAAASA
jgi:uncharacterized damage-inducible protein DinB